MTIDLHIHSRTCSDGNLTVKEIVKEAKARTIRLMSITDHDSVACQREAQLLAQKENIRYLPGVELNVTFFPSRHRKRAQISLDFLGYMFEIDDCKLQSKLAEMKKRREIRAVEILSKLNTEFSKEGRTELTMDDLRNIRSTADGVLGRPHIANYLVKQGIVTTQSEAFEKYLIKCNVPKYPLHLEDASKLVRNAGGFLVLAHPNDPHGTSLNVLTTSLHEQTQIINNSILQHIDGIECWHSRHDAQTSVHYVKYSREHGLIMTCGSDCHQRPILMGTVKVPIYVSHQFDDIC